MTGRERYFGTARVDILPFLPDARDLSVLELGCGTGATAALLRSNHIAATVWGVELDATAAGHARSTLDDVVVGDVEVVELPPDWRADLILALDVVEHLRRPEIALKRVVDRHLRTGGWLLTCTPNVRYWRVLYDLAIRGRFEYEDSGILDRTHLRFFTRSSIVRMHTELGLDVELVAAGELSGKRAILDKLTGSRLRDLLVGQHVVRSRLVAAR